MLSAHHIGKYFHLLSKQIINSSTNVRSHDACTTCTIITYTIYYILLEQKYISYQSESSCLPVQVFTWTGVYLYRCLRGQVFTCTALYLYRCLPGQVLTWTGIYLDRYLPGQIFTWTGIYQAMDASTTQSHSVRNIQSCSQ